MIVPTLNEEDYLGRLLESLRSQTVQPHEILVVDGGSQDDTLAIAERFGLKTISLPGVKEWPAMNHGAELASGDILLFTGADVVYPRKVLENITRRFARDRELLAVGGPGVPDHPPLLLGLEFKIYNWMRYLVGRLPGRFKRFSASTNLIAIRREAFDTYGPIGSDPRNADGMLAAKLCAAGKVHFSYSEIRVYSSARRMWDMGFIAFNRHYLYVIENFFQALSKWGFLRRLKEKTAPQHSTMRADPDADAMTEAVTSSRG